MSPRSLVIRPAHEPVEIAYATALLDMPTLRPLGCGGGSESVESESSVPGPCAGLED